jgi:RimJ/RimL family protein N-acetyltransferase
MAVIANGSDTENVDVIAFTDPVAFSVRVRPVIDAYPAAASILATVLDQAMSGRLFEQATWLLITDGERPVGAAMHTPPFNLFVTPMPQGLRTHGLSALAGTLHIGGRELAGVSGPIAEAEVFTQAWLQETGCRAKLSISERLYEISESPIEPGAAPEPSGAPRLATEADVALTAGWLHAFHLESVPEQAGTDAEQAVRHRIAEANLLVWDDEGPVSMAGLSRVVAGVCRVGVVFTPAVHRRRGYATAVTAAATRLGLDRGATSCVLYADLANPTSNAIYQAIGYRPVDDAVMISFRPR